MNGCDCPCHLPGGGTSHPNRRCVCKDPGLKALKALDRLGHKVAPRTRQPSHKNRRRST